MQGFIWFLTITFSGLSLAVASPKALTLEGYLTEVSQKNQELQALKLSSEGARLRVLEGGLLTRPALFAGIKLLDDKKPTANPNFQGTQTQGQEYSAGITEQFPFGLNAKLSYTINHVEIAGALPTFLPIPNYYEARPQIELTQSFLRNGFGRETRAMRDLLEWSARTQSETDNFKAKAKLSEAEGTYWALALTREVVKVQGESLERAKKIREWNSKRARLELADRSDLLQSEAGLQARTLEYQTAVEEQGALERRFNHFRGSEANSVEESLEPINNEALSKVAVPEKKGVRGDVKAAEAGAKLAESNANLGREKNLPTLDVTGALALNGRDVERGEATSQSFGTRFPTYGVGVKFVAPLDFGTVSNNREGYNLEVKAADLRVKQAQLDEVRDWKELVIRLEESKKRLLLSHDIEKKQQEKLEYERKRLNRGRSVTYQVLLFEQDFLQAQAIRLKTAGEILRILSQMKLFCEEK